MPPTDVNQSDVIPRIEVIVKMKKKKSRWVARGRSPDIAGARVDVSQELQLL